MIGAVHQASREGGQGGTGEQEHRGCGLVLQGGHEQGFEVEPEASHPCNICTCMPPRKKIEGAIKSCELDSENLVRTFCSLRRFVLLRCRNNRYGGETEYYVEVRETGSMEQGRYKTLTKKQVEQDLS